MMNFFGEKCPVCGTKLEKGREYPASNGKKFDTEKCKEKYEHDIAAEKPHSSGGCCH